jgi:hypothetical protein
MNSDSTLIIGRTATIETFATRRELEGGMIPLLVIPTGLDIMVGIEAEVG